MRSVQSQSKQKQVKILLAILSVICIKSSQNLSIEAFTPVPSHLSSTASIRKSCGLCSSIQDSVRSNTKKTPTNGKKSLKSNKKNASTSNKNDYFMTKSMLSHEILTKKEENQLGKCIAKARELRSRISKYVMEKRLNGSDSKIMPPDNDKEFDFDLMERLGDLENAKSIPSSSMSTNIADESILSIHFDTLLRQDILNLDEDDIVDGLSIPGGKAELISILTAGINARRKLISCNIKLVTSISRSWMRRSIISSSAISNSSPTSKYGNINFAPIYQSGAWDLPSLDEVIHEGIIGLSKAADKYEAKRGNKFSTYATYWVTAYVRQCFRNASTGCLRVPAALHQIKSDHGKILKRHYELNLPLPSEEDIAKEIGVNVKRLRTALRSTKSLISIDASINSGSQNYKGSGAGGDSVDKGELVIADTLKCSEPKPLEYVELSILRECLENAMASELSPHERDVIRLRLGLDDGKTRTVREVVDLCGGAVSMSEVRSAERRAFKKLRSPNTMHSHNLMSFLDQIDVMDKYSTHGMSGW